MGKSIVSPALAEKVKELNSNTTTTITVTISNSTVGVNWIRKRGNMVTLSLLVNVSTNIGSSWTEIGTIPSGYRPLDEVRFNMVAKGGGIIDTRIRTDGIIDANSDSNISSPLLRFTVTYPV